MKEENNAILGCSFATFSLIGVVVGIVFCILQACGTWNISWFWATFPFWIFPAAFIGIFALTLTLVFIVALTFAIITYFERIENFC